MALMIFCACLQKDLTFSPMSQEQIDHWHVQHVYLDSEFPRVIPSFCNVIKSLLPYALVIWTICCFSKCQVLSVIPAFRHVSPSITNLILLSSHLTAAPVLTHNTAQLTSWGELNNVPPRPPFKEALTAPTSGNAVVPSFQLEAPLKTALPGTSIPTQIHAPSCSSLYPMTDKY